jgi:hypothetical protein
MNRRETLLKLSGITGVPVLLGACNMDAVRRAESNLGWRMRQPGTGVQFTGVPEVVKVIILATYPATPTQTQVATVRAQKVVKNIAKRHTPQKKSTAVAKKTSSKPEPGKPAIASGGGAEASPAEEAKTVAAVLKEESGTPVIAIDTQTDNRLQGTRAVMLWNTQSQRLVGNNVYDISSPPAKGQVAQWGSVTARYVGSGDSL